MKINVPHTGKDAFKFLKDNKADIVAMKRSENKYADATKLLLSWAPANKALMGLLTDKRWVYENDEEKGTLKRSIAMNTYNWLDAHDDVHLDGIFTKSLKERGGQALHLHDHDHTLGSKVGMPIKWSEEVVSWKSLGVDLPGTTTILVLHSEIQKRLNPQVYEMYLADEIDQHSIGMRYVKIDLAVNEPKDKYFADEYKVWLEVIDRIGNKALAEDQGYFWAVREASVFEGSAVLFGANELTPVLGKSIEPQGSTHKKNVEPDLVPFDVEKMLNHYQIKK